MRKLSVRPSVRPSVCPSVKRVDCDKTEERSVQIFIPYERSFSLVFWEEEWLVGATPCTWNFGSNWPRWSEIADFRSLFARSDSAVTPSEKTSINTNGKSTTRFPMSPRWTSYVIVFNLQRVAQKRTVSKIWTISCDNSETVRCQLPLITNKNSHRSIRLVPTSMTPNDFERRNSPYFAFFSPNSTDFRADYITVVEDRPIMSVKYCLSVPVFYFWRKL